MLHPVIWDYQRLPNDISGYNTISRIICHIIHQNDWRRHLGSKEENMWCSLEANNMERKSKHKKEIFDRIEKSGPLRRLKRQHCETSNNIQR